jgi:hypothetical protein
MTPAARAPGSAVGLGHPYDDLFQTGVASERVGDAPGHRLDQLDMVTPKHPFDHLNHGFVIQSIPDVVLDCGTELDFDIEHQHLSAAAFVIVHSNLSRQFQTGNEDGHAVLGAVVAGFISHGGQPPHQPNF